MSFQSGYPWEAPTVDPSPTILKFLDHCPAWSGNPSAPGSSPCLLLFLLLNPTFLCFISFHILTLLVFLCFVQNLKHKWVKDVLKQLVVEWQLSHCTPQGGGFTSSGEKWIAPFPSPLCLLGDQHLPGLLTWPPSHEWRLRCVLHRHPN